ncbi:metal ABC transporter ATP-binding protein [Pseudocitrobacter sp. 73]|uniref:metal ABC transporter ATP-binding protein n=1 Tax=Pseudocitrobacter sp. 73 TaxID=2605731 RepID=UPI0021068D3C|nr:ATP-binding cassette domain-containing protein [Pseudocitrobacter sp. 73]
MAGHLVGGITAMIVLDNLLVGYDGEAIAPPIDGCITRGSLMAIVGENGCGKSTLLKTVAGFIPPVSGRVHWQTRRPVIGWLAQRQALDQQFPVTVQDVVCQGVWPRISLCFGIDRMVRRRVADALDRVGLLPLAKTAIGSLSGGQFQRMLFARILVQQAPLVMLDEPFTGVDETTTEMLMSLILDMQRHGQTVLAVLHDSEKVARFFPQLLELGDARAISPMLIHRAINKPQSVR